MGHLTQRPLKPRASVQDSTSQKRGVLNDGPSDSENTMSEPPRRPTKNDMVKNRGVVNMLFSETLRARTTLEAQPLIFRGLFSGGERGTSDTEASEDPRLRTRFDVGKTRGFKRRAQGI